MWCNRQTSWFVGKTSASAFIVLAGCCPKAENCFHPPETLTYRIDGYRDEEPTVDSCGAIDFSPGDVISFQETGEVAPPMNDRQCSGCPIYEVSPVGDFPGWSQVERIEVNAEYGDMVGQSSAIVDGCRVEIELRISHLAEEGDLTYGMYRRIDWLTGCPNHTGTCYDNFRMTESSAGE